MLAPTMSDIVDGQESDRRLRRDLAVLLPELRAFARFLAGSASEADDLVQEALLRTLRALDGGRAAEVALRPWCLAVIRNVFQEQLRARKRETRHREHSAVAAATAPAAPEQEQRGEVRDLARALQNLPPLLREALVLVGAQGLSYEEAAAVCGVPPGTMKARVSRARRQLAAALDPVTE